MSLFPSSLGLGPLTFRVWLISRLSLILDGLLLLLLLAWVVSPTVFAPPLGPQVHLFPTRHYIYFYRHRREVEPVYTTITQDGQAYWHNQPVRVDELHDLVRDAVVEHDRTLRTKGRVGFEDAPEGGYLAKLTVVLRVDRDARWGAVHPVLRCLGRCGVFDVHFLAADGAGIWNGMPSSLPACLRAPRPDAVFMRVKMTTAEGGALHCEVDGVPVQDPATLEDLVSQRVRELLRRLGHEGPPSWCSRLRGVIEADPDTPFENVLAVLEAFLDCDMDSVSFVAPGDDPTLLIQAEATRQFPGGR